MPRIEWEAGDARIEVDSDNAIALNAPELMELTRTIQHSRSLVSLSELIVDKASGEDGDPDSYSIEIVCVCGRTFSMGMLWDIPGDPLVTFAVPVGYRRSEYDGFFPLRKAVMALILRYSITRIAANF